MALKGLFFAGARGQQLFPVLALKPSVVQDSIDGGEDQTIPMLSVNGLLLKDLQPLISKMNKYLPDNPQTGISLHDGPHKFTITGPPRALYGLIANLHTIRAPNGSDQSKVKFAKQKPVFSMCFLVMGVPFYSQYLQDAADKVISQDLNGKKLWTAEGPQF